MAAARVKHPKDAGSLTLRIKKKDLPKSGSAVIVGMIRRGSAGSGRMTNRNQKRRKNPKNSPFEE